MMEKISVIVPVFNIAEYLVRCLDSIIAQTYSNLEIVAVNDGSTDNSGQVLDEYASKHPNVKVIHQENSGVTSARVHGVAEATGEWIGFVDGDDEIEPDMYERLINNAHTYGAQISHCGYQMHFTDGRIHYFHNTGLLAKQDKTTALKELFSGSRIEPGLWNKLFHKPLFHSLLHDEIMPLDIKINEDLLMNFYLFSEAETSVFDDWCPYHYLVRSTSASRAKLNEHKLLDPIKVRRIILEHCPESLHDAALIGYINACLNECNTIITNNSSGYYNEYCIIKSMLIAEKEHFHLLGCKRKYMAFGTVYIPRIYGCMYRFYVRKLKKKVYE